MFPFPVASEGHESASHQENPLVASGSPFTGSVSNPAGLSVRLPLALPPDTTERFIENRGEYSPNPFVDGLVQPGVVGPISGDGSLVLPSPPQGDGNTGERLASVSSAPGDVVIGFDDGEHPLVGGLHNDADLSDEPSPSADEGLTVPTNDVVGVEEGGSPLPEPIAPGEGESEVSDASPPDAEILTVPTDPEPEVPPPPPPIVNPLNSPAPVNTVPLAQTIRENTELVFSAANGNALSISSSVPTLSASVSIPEGTGRLTVTQSSGAFVINNDTYVVTLLGTPAQLNGALSGLVYTPPEDANGTPYTTLALNTSDIRFTDTDTVAINIVAVNDVPIATGETLPDVAEDSVPYSIPFASLLGNDVAGPTNEQNQTLTIAAISHVIGGTASLSDAGVVFTPAADYNGPAGFQYTIQDNGTTDGVADPQIATATVTFTMTPVNDGPIATGDILPNLPEDTATQGMSLSTLLGNDSAGPTNEGDQAVVVLAVGNGIGGTVELSDGNVLFTPTADFTGTAGFQYTLQDNGTTNGVADPKTAIATVTFDITPINDDPLATGEALTDVAEDSGIRTIPIADLLVNDSPGPTNEQDQSLTIVGLSNVVGGTATLSDAAVLFTPTPDYNGPASFQYTIQDNGTTNGLADAKTAIATATFAVTPVNDTPIATDERLADLTEDSGTRTISIASLLANDSPGPTNESDQSLTIASISNVVGGTASISGTEILFTPAPNYNGPASFEYLVQDNGTTNGLADAKTARATASFTITPVNDAPSATGETLADLTEDSSTRTIPVASLLSNDRPGPDNEQGQRLTIVGVSNAVGGTAVLSGSAILFTPTPNYSGSASFQYTIEDDGTTNGAADPKTAIATASFPITPVNDAPIITSPNRALVESAGSAINGISLSDVDAGSGSLTATLSVANGILTLTNLNGASVIRGGLGTGTVSLSGTLAQLNAALSTLRYSSGNFSGNTNLTVTLTDNGNTGGGALTDTDTVVLNVANDVGVLGNSSVNVRGSVDGSDPLDRYQFTLSTPTTNFRLSLNGLTDNVDVFLLNGNGNRIRSGTNSGSQSEEFNGLDLDAGTYFIEVRRVSGSTRYNLSFRR